MIWLIDRLTRVGLRPVRCRPRHHSPSFTCVSGTLSASLFEQIDIEFPCFLLDDQPNDASEQSSCGSGSVLDPLLRKPSSTHSSIGTTTFSTPLFPWPPHLQTRGSYSSPCCDTVPTSRTPQCGTPATGSFHKLAR